MSTGSKATAGEQVIETINTYFPGSVFMKNVMVGGPSGIYPPDNFFPPSFDQVVFVDRAAGNYRLAPASPYKNAGTDSKDIGCDFDALNAAINGTAVVTKCLGRQLHGDYARARFNHDGLSARVYPQLRFRRRASVANSCWEKQQ